MRVCACLGPRPGHTLCPCREREEEERRGREYHPLTGPRTMPIQQHGWICPKCGHVYAPFMPACTNCNMPTTKKQEPTKATPDAR